MKTIMVAPINWGLGHATRCIPIIQALLQENFEVIIASDGASRNLLRKEFPNINSIQLPSYNITYPSNGRSFKLKMLKSLPHIYKVMKEEEIVINGMVERGEIDGIISDGRFGVFSHKIPSVYITHQLNVLTGGTTFFSTRLHQKIIKKFDECWVPDVKDMALNHSGILGHLSESPFPVRYFGIVSRMKPLERSKNIDILALISGPEPQRTYLEKRLKKILAKSDKAVVMVRGVIEEEQNWEEYGNIRIVNFMESGELENTINKSELIISRSGYTTIMDLAVLEKKAFFIPTPGQYEQEYLANHLNELGISPFCKQNEFNLEKLDAVSVYRGLKPSSHSSEDFTHLFALFHGE